MQPRKLNGITTRSGFSLVEMAGVAVLIALLIGAVFAGLSLRHSSELKVLMQEVGKYRDAIVLFQEKYHALPGDMINATDIWGELDADPATCQATPSTSFETCNGNGDGSIAPGFGTYYEAFRAWQHLANARLIEGSYTGEYTSTLINKPCNIKNHCGTSRYPGAFFFMAHPGTDIAYFNISHPAGLIDLFPGDKGHVLVASGPSTFNNSGSSDQPVEPIFPLLYPEEQAGIDQKYDDGKPGTGMIQSFIQHVGGAFSQACPDSDDSETALYNFTYDESTAATSMTKGAQCVLIVTHAF